MLRNDFGEHKKQEHVLYNTFRRKHVRTLAGRQRRLFSFREVNFPYNKLKQTGAYGKDVFVGPLPVLFGISSDAEGGVFPASGVSRL